MNAAAKALAQGNFVNVGPNVISWSSKTLGMFLLLGAMLASAFAVVYIKALDRELFSELQMLQQQHENLNVKAGQLLLEQNTWASPARVQAIAQQQLGMVVPAAKEVTVISVNQNPGR